MATRRENHVTPTVDKFVEGMNGKIVFKKVDLSAGYYEIELDEDCRYITTFATHCGLKRHP